MDVNEPFILSAFFIQVFVLLSYIPVTFIAYRWLREPERRRRTGAEVSKFNLPETEELRTRMRQGMFRVSEYILPIAYITLILAALYSMTHPAIIRLGIWRGLLESTVNIFGLENGGTPVERELLSGRFMFYCWLGAYIHGVDRTIRHYLLQDLSPNVYVLSARRFIVTFVVGTIVGVGVGSTVSTSIHNIDYALPVVFVVCFFIGLFPDRGIRWISTFANKVLRQKNEEEESMPLSAIQGIGEWQRSRMDQEGIVNVQNLATANLMRLVWYTPFDVGQLVDWTDQAILLIYASPKQVSTLQSIGLRCATDVLNAVDGKLTPLAEACGVSQSELIVLADALRAAVNIDLCRRYWVGAATKNSAVMGI
jgi:hypothetical protein